MTDTLEAVISLILIAAVIPHALAWAILRGAAIRGKRIAALDERLSAARWWLFSATIIAAIVINVMAGRPIPLQPPWTQLLLGLALLSGAVPAALFVVRFWTGYFQD